MRKSTKTKESDKIVKKFEYYVLTNSLCYGNISIAKKIISMEEIVYVNFYGKAC